MKKKIKVADLSVLYRQEGRGKPVLLLHGWGKSEAVFSPLCQRLKKSFLTLTPDLPGFGGSDLPPEAWGVKEYARFADQFAAQLGLGKIPVIGHSFGGRIAIELAAFYPQRVEKLVLTGVPILRRGRVKRFCFLCAAKLSRLVFALPPFFLFKNQFRKLLYFLAGETDYYQAKGLRREIFKKIIAYNQKKSLEKIKAPTLIVWGEDDRVTPLTDARALHQAMSYASLKVIPGASHKVPYEKPKQFAKSVINFLDKSR